MTETMTSNHATFKLVRDWHFPWIGWQWSVTLRPFEVDEQPLTFSGCCLLRKSAERHISFTLGWGQV